MTQETVTQLTAITAAVVTLVNLLMLVVLVLQMRAQKVGRRTEDLFTLMEFLHRTEFRDARMEVLHTQKNASLGPKNAWAICSSFDFAGLMVREKLVDHDLFLRYWGPVIRLLGNRLQPFIADTEFEPGLTGTQYWEHCTWLIEEARK